MKLKRLLEVPVALACDIVTIGNMGGRSFTQQVFDAERQEQANDAAVKLVAEIVKAVAAGARK